jgi:aminoacyl tRNA synthase complex-interacting multifunctional protein 1
MDIRVGKIVKVWKHPESEKLYCEEVDMGNGEIRKIASGL